MLCYTFLY